MRCKDCGYFWCDEGEKVPVCHFEGWVAPCEEESESDNYYDDYDDYYDDYYDDCDESEE